MSRETKQREASIHETSILKRKVEEDEGRSQTAYMFRNAWAVYFF